ncbi:MAG TPA: Lrp/AsnC family transcriptional regulator [Mycobacteriales bacterium]|jgi:DNA-binding Lrp family transcriptional regulator|nr:Lrp/AsnC family transcriptional regulator [Mycobacteriales bacterium]
MSDPDALDGRILLLFSREPRIGVLEASRRLGVARGTVQARLDRLEREGVVTGWAPQVDPSAIGFPVSAFATLEIAQAAGHGPVADHLRTIPEVLEAHTITGGADLMVRLVARSNADLQRVIDQVVAAPSVRRASTVIVLATEIAPRVSPLIDLLSATNDAQSRQ